MAEDTVGYAVVTGGGSGIGRGIALALAQANHELIIADLNLEAAQTVAKEIIAKGRKAIAVQVDTTDKSSVANLVAQAQKKFPRIDALINSAGVIVSKKLIEATDDDWGFIMSVNLFGIINCCTAFAPIFVAQKAGHIVNNASQAALIAHNIEGLGLYTTTKHACLGYTESLRNEFAPVGVNVSVLCPGRVQSNLGRTSAQNRPEKFGGPTDTPDDDGPLTPDTITAEECGDIVVNAMKEKRFLITTHPKRWNEIEARYDAFRRDNEAERKRQSEN